MKVVLIGDPHVRVRGERVRGIDSAGRLDTCVARINAIAGDADLCVVMGDNVDVPSEAAYRTFLDGLRPLRMPVRCLLGNHDDRAIFRTVQPDLPCDEHGFVQSTIETDACVLVFLDTHKPGSEAGEYCARRLSWFRRTLREAGRKPVYVFMHHPPFRTGFFIDHAGLEAPEALVRAMTDAGTVRHVFAGHTHRAASGCWNGLAWSTLHGIAYQNDFELLPAKPNYRGGPAQIGVLLLDGGESVLHFQDSLEPYPCIAYSGRSLREPGPA
ncbi:phosphodiesterase [Labrys wisconsinensis]|uniref:3',5'-cyclic AMP phosphodiesterase CpdA n=1 Tax=Labrys wisconsinensis TaxID=425677 RepID=A0ABU0JGF1_9HYPH|nr:phosphodiesterase [Labrys wisconsinensis]MDQ0472650.1 3',5'-cyclic AMP phosphodiesterase CpdA [Labrys wisconsinensis]